MDLNYCRRCGSKLTQKTNTLYLCGSQHSIFLNPSPTVGVFFIDDKNNVILSRRGIEPNKNMLDSFGGFLDGMETFEQALERELIEELNIHPSNYTKPQFLCSGISGYSYAGEDVPVVTVCFWAKLVGEPKLVAADDVAEVVILPIDHVDLDDLCNEDIRIGFIELKNRINKGL